MLRWAIVFFILFCSSAALAAQATGQFQVGITITGKSGAAPRANTMAAAAANAAAVTSSSSTQRGGEHPVRIGTCSYSPASAASGLYQDSSGRIYQNKGGRISYCR